MTTNSKDHTGRIRAPLVAWVRMLRLHTSLIYPTAGFAASLFASGAPVFRTSTIIPFLSIFLLSISAYMLNDVFDVGVDKISNRDRPIPSGVLSSLEVGLAGGASLLVGILLVLVFGSIFSFVVALVLAFLAFSYSAPPFRLRRLFLAPYLTIAGSVSLSFLLAASFRGGPMPAKFVLGTFLVFGYGTGSCMVKEFKDVEGDSQMGVRSIPTILGVERGAQVTIPAYLGACLLVLPFYWLFELNPLFLVAFAAIFLGKAKTSYDLLSDPNDRVVRKRILEVEVVSTILLFLFAAISAVI